MTYQIESARTDPTTLTRRARAKLSFPAAANAPMASSAGTAGSGTPICSAKTERKITSRL
jgi:hypothetical protein